MDRDSSVGIVTLYGLDGLGFESRLGGEIFRTSRIDQVSTHALIKYIQRHSRG